MTGRGAAVLGFACACLGWPARAAHAQGRVTAGAAAEITAVRAERRLTTDTVTLSGATFGFTGDVSVGPFQLVLAYRQGAVESDDGAASADLVEGNLALAVRPARFLSLGIVGDARAYLTDAGTERWLQWSGVVGAEARLGATVRSFLTLSVAFAGSTNTGPSLASGRGASGGLMAQLPGSPVTVTAGYRVGRAELGGDGRSDVVEEAYLAMGIRLGR